MMQRHFTCSVYVYRADTRQFLFIKHKKLGKWLQPGGHVDPDELPDTAAVREVLEETGLCVELLGERLPRETDPVRPYGVQLNVIKAGEHEHIDLIYLAVPVGGCELTLNEQETEGIGWMTLAEIEDEGFDTYEPQRDWCRRFYGMMNGE